MRAFKRFDKRGFTLVELMIVVAIIGVLAALAIYGVIRYLATAKTSEAKDIVGAIARGGQAAYERETTVAQLVAEGANSAATSHDVCLAAASVPATVPAGKKYQPNSAVGQDFNVGDATIGWPCLRFTATSPIYYQYNYGAKGTGYIASAKGGPDPGADGFEATAVGDVDADGVTSLFSRAGFVNTATGTIRLSTQVFINDEYE